MSATVCSRESSYFTHELASNYLSIYIENKLVRGKVKTTYPPYILPQAFIPSQQTVAPEPLTPLGQVPLVRVGVLTVGVGEEEEVVVVTVV